MSFDGATLIPTGGTVDPAALAAAQDAVFGLNGVAGDGVPQIASASTCSIFAGTGDVARLVEITGTTGISSFGTHEAGEFREIRFASAGCVVNHSAAIDCPGGANLTSEAGMTVKVVGDGTNCKIWWPGAPSSLASAPAASFPPGFLFGLILSNNSTDAANDIDITSGKARSADDTANIALGTGLTKRLDAAWSAGTNQGGLDTGSKANSTTYHVHLISDGASTVDVLFSTSAASPTMPGGYTKARRIGAVITDGGGNIRAFSQQGDDFLLVTPPLDINAAISTSRSLIALTVPSGLAVEARIRAINTSGSFGVVIQPPAETDAAPASGASPLYSLNISNDPTTLSVRTDTSRQVALRATGSSTVRGVTLGWTDTRGRLA
jgi:hypothetical protein